MFHKSNSQRKTAACFINEDSPIKPMQCSPRPNADVEKRGPFTICSNFSKTNFIEESNLIPEEGPRAFVVTGTGEKHYIPLDQEVAMGTSLKPFTLHDRSSTVILSKSDRQSSTHKRPSSNHKSSAKENTAKQIKISRPARRHLSHKVRLAFTPRNNDEKVLQEHFPLPRAVNNITVETQTDAEPLSLSLSSKALQSRIPKMCNNFYEPMEQKELMQPPLQSNKRIYSLANPKLKYYTDLRGIASVLTFITVFSWLLTTFFEMEILSDILGYVVRIYRSWRSTEELPKTKAELVVQFLVSLWS